MDYQTAKWVWSCVPHGRTLFYYFKDRYANLILARAIRERVRISELRERAFAKLLTKPAVCELVAVSGDGEIRGADLDYVWREPYEAFLLTLGVTRAGHG